MKYHIKDRVYDEQGTEVGWVYSPVPPEDIEWTAGVRPRCRSRYAIPTGEATRCTGPLGHEWTHYGWIGLLSYQWHDQ